MLFPNQPTFPIDLSEHFARYEMGNWRPVRNKFGRNYSRNYTKHFPISEPEEDFDDRNALYST